MLGKVDRLQVIGRFGRNVGLSALSIAQVVAWVAALVVCTQLTYDVIRLDSREKSTGSITSKHG